MRKEETGEDTRSAAGSGATGWLPGLPFQVQLEPLLFVLQEDSRQSVAAGVLKRAGPGVLSYARPRTVFEVGRVAGLARVHGSPGWTAIVRGSWPGTPISKVCVCVCVSGVAWGVSNPS